jgi:hypothetical protein
VPGLPGDAFAEGRLVLPADATLAPAARVLDVQEGAARQVEGDMKPIRAPLDPLSAALSVRGRPISS